MNLVKGIDVSHYQKGIDWKAVVADGVKFAIIKFADGEDGTDPLCALFRKQAKDAGLIVGGYCFGRFWADPIKQAEHFFKTVGDVLEGELPLSLDYEWDNSDLTKAHFKGKYSDSGEADADSDLHAFHCLGRLEKLSGMVPMLYTAPSFFTSKNPAFARYPLWLNDFKAKDAGVLRTPKVWPRATFWQYREAPAYGVSGVDFNYFLGSLEELRAMTKGALPSVPSGTNGAAKKDAIAALQGALNGVGVSPSLAADGVAGAKTKDALRWASENL